MYADFQVIFSSKTFKRTANIRIFNAFFERIWAETMDEKLRAGVFERIPSIIINPAGDYTVTFHVTIPGVHSETNVRSFLGRFFIQNTQKTANIRIFNAFFESFGRKNDLKICIHYFPSGLLGFQILILYKMFKNCLQIYKKKV